MINKETAKQRIRGLLEKYDKVVEENRFSKYTEEETKKDFIRPMFHALGWDTEDSREVSAEEKISKKKVDYGFKINGIPKFFLEAKPLKANLDDPEFAEQAINYAWHKGCTWAVLSDFDQGVKIFNAEWKTADLFQSHFKTIPRQEFLDRFEELWSLSKEGFEQGLLDKEAEKYGKKSKKTPVSEQLLNDLTKWRAELSKDILWRNRGKHLTEEDLDEAVQRIIDRLIFIRNCEDRELEPITLLSTMREWGSKRKGTLAERIVDVFRHFDKEYNSKLFEHHICDDLDISNQVLEEIINGLDRTEDRTIRYDFSALDADVLGNVYEQYLGHILKKTAKRVTLTKKHARRKEQGIYYTPTYIVDYIVRNTLGELLEDEKVDVEKIRVLDLACGSGSFLRKAFDILNEFYSEAGEDYGQIQLDEMGLPFTKKVKILRNNIFGVDLDPRAGEIAQLNLLLKIAEKKHRLPMLQQNIRCGNSLIDDEKIAGDKAFKWEQEFKQIMDEGGFDVVIGNPPYVSNWQLSKTDRKMVLYLDKKYSDVTMGHWDLYVIFIRKALSLLKKDGYFSFIVPTSFLMEKYGKKLREYIVRNFSLISLVDFGVENVFEDVARQYTIFVIKDRKNIDNKTQILEYEDGQFKVKSEIKQKDFLNFHNCTYRTDLSQKDISLVQKIEDDFTPLGSLCCVNVGVVAHSKTGSPVEFKKDDVVHDGFHDGYKKYIEGRNISRYRADWKGKYIDYDSKSEFFHRPKFKELFETLKIIVRRVSGKNNSILSTYDDSKLYTNDNLIHLLLWDNSIIKKQKPEKKYPIDNSSKHLSLKYIQAILNSKLITYYFNRTIATGTLQGTYSGVYPEDLRRIPIRKVDKEVQKPIIELVDKMLILNKRLNEIGDKRTDERQGIEEEVEKTDAETDESVYRLYGITESEKKIIESG